MSRDKAELNQGSTFLRYFLKLLDSNSYALALNLRRHRGVVQCAMHFENGFIIITGCNAALHSCPKQANLMTVT